MAAKKKQKRHATPVGTIVTGFIQRPSTKYSKDPNGAYALSLAFDGTEEGFDDFKAFLEKVSAKAHAHMVEESPKNKRLKPFEYLKPEIDDEGNETGRVLFKLEQTASWKDGAFRKLPVFDENLKPWSPDLLIGNGSKASGSFTLGQPYAAEPPVSCTGAKPWLQAVQVVDFVEYTAGGDGESFGFGKHGSDDDDDVGFGGIDEPQAEAGSDDFDY